MNGIRKNNNNHSPQLQLGFLVFVRGFTGCACVFFSDFALASFSPFSRSGSACGGTGTGDWDRDGVLFSPPSRSGSDCGGTATGDGNHDMMAHCFHFFSMSGSDCGGTGTGDGDCDGASFPPFSRSSSD